MFLITPAHKVSVALFYSTYIRVFLEIGCEIYYKYTWYISDIDKTWQAKKTQIRYRVFKKLNAMRFQAKYPFCIVNFFIGKI